jgi:hypothetical protein
MAQKNIRLDVAISKLTIAQSSNHPLTLSLFLSFGICSATQLRNPAKLKSYSNQTKLGASSSTIRLALTTRSWILARINM